MVKIISEFQVCFLISLIAHTGLISAGGFNFDFSPEKKPFEIEFQLEEKLPERYEIDREKIIKKPVMDKKEVVEPVAEKEQKPAETDEKAILRYQDSVKQKIQEEKMYPRWALRMGREGTVRIAFYLTSSGNVKKIDVIQGSGIKEFDAEAVDAVRRANPFLPFPDSFKENELRFEIDMIFKIAQNSQ